MDSRPAIRCKMAIHRRRFAMLKAKIVENKKWCNKCKKFKLFTDFRKVKRRGCGLSGWCKSCLSENSIRWATTTINGRAWKKKSNRRWHKRNIVKARAHLELFRAIRRGEIDRKPCQTCGNKKTHGHHYLGYDKNHWLDVMWLCPKHHREIHSGQESQR